MSDAPTPRTSTTMRAVTHHRYGGPEVLSVEEVPRPTVSPDRLVVRVHAAEACKSDTEMRSFRWSVKWFWLPLRLGLGVRRPRRSILGLYFAGVVEDVGSEITGFELGDAVYGSPGMKLGAYGEWLALPRNAVIGRKPASMTFAEAAAVPLGAQNALHFLKLAGVAPGDRVLVNGAGGVIGAHGVQIAKAMGGVVTGVDAGHKEAFVRDMGADVFVDYRLQNVTDLAERFDVILDMVPTSSVTGMLGLLDRGGRYANGNPRLSTMLRAPFVTRFTDKRMIIRFAEESRHMLDELTAMIDDGSIRPIVDRVLPMDEATEAHRLVETEQRIGAVVLAIGPRADER